MPPGAVCPMDGSRPLCRQAGSIFFRSALSADGPSAEPLVLRLVQPPASTMHEIEVAMNVRAVFNTTLSPAEEKVAERFVQMMVVVSIGKHGADQPRIAKLAAWSESAHGVEEERVNEIIDSLASTMWGTGS